MSADWKTPLVTLKARDDLTLRPAHAVTRVLAALGITVTEEANRAE